MQRFLERGASEGEGKGGGVHLARKVPRRRGITASLLGEQYRPAFEVRRSPRRSTVLLLRADDVLVVEVPSRFALEWIESKYGDLLRATTKRVLRRPGSSRRHR